MSFSKAVLNYLFGLEESRMMLRVPAALLPFVVHAAILCLVLFALAFFTVAPLASFMTPIVERLGGENALHYPMHLILLPDMYHLVYLPLTAVVGFVLFGWAVFAMGDHFQRGGVEMGARPSLLRSAPTLVVIGVCYVAAATLVPAAIAWLGRIVDHPRLGGLLTLAGLVATAALQALLVYAPLFVRTHGAGPFSALRRSVGLGRRRFAPTAMIVLTVILVHQPIDFLLRQPDRVVVKFQPELVIYLLLAGVVLELLTAFLLFSSTAGLALSRREREAL